jgi:hypothetical protein
MSAIYEHISKKAALQGIQANSKSSFLNSKQIQITETKNSKQYDLGDKFLVIWI